MYFQIRKIQTACLVLSLCFASLASANDGGGHGEAPKGDGHGKPEAAAASKKRTNEESYGAVAAKVAALEAKVRSGEQEIQKLVDAKAHAHSSSQVNEIIKNMLTLHHELQKNIQDYDRQRSLLRYRYPEKAASEGREYERIELKSLEEMEGAASLTAAVRKTLIKVRTQFPVEEKIMEAQNVAPKGRKPASEQSTILDPVIFKK